MNNDRAKPHQMTLGGIFLNPNQKELYNNAQCWAGNIFMNDPKGFHKKKTFMTEWESAINNHK